MLPGLTDAHLHFLGVATRRQQVNLFGLNSLDALAAALRDVVANAQPGQWIQGWGWDDRFWDATPTAAWLDAVAPDNPLVLARMDMHTIWVNSPVLRAAGISRETPDPPEATIGRDADGHPNGLLSEWNAIDLVKPHIPRDDRATVQRWVEETMAEANALGLTGIHDLRVEREGRQSLQIFQALHRAGRLNLRVHFNIASDYLPEAAQLGLQAGFGDDRLWLGHMKAFADGTMGSRTASMLTPFDDDPGNTGLIVTPSDELWTLITKAGHAGFPIAVHAIGDRAVRDVIDVMAEWTTTYPDAAHSLPMPQRIEHVQVIHPDDLPRLAAHHIAASVQPIHLQTDWPTADRVWGDRARYAYAFRSLLDHGTVLALGSDAPVAPYDPFQNIYAAVTRHDEQGGPDGGWYPQERLTVAEAIAGYTMAPAYLSGKTAQLGSLSPGKWADFIVVSQDLFTIDPEAIPETAVEMTVLGGQVVVERS